MFREIRSSERITEKDLEEARKNENYTKIKPENETTDEECNIFWASVFKGQAL